MGALGWVCVCVVWDIQFVTSSSTHSMQHALTIFNASRRARASATSGVDAGRAMAMVESACMAVYCCNTQPRPVYFACFEWGTFWMFRPRRLRCLRRRARLGQASFRWHCVLGSVTARPRVWLRNRVLNALESDRRELQLASPCDL